MAHKTLIGGTAYEIGGGKTLVNGTARSIDKGKTLVGGTVYEVGFGPSTAILTLNTSTTKMTDVIINGTEYSTTTTLEVPIGTVVRCRVDSESSKEGYVDVNDHTVFNSYYGYYDYVVTGNATIVSSYKQYDGDLYGYIAITEQ